MENFTSNIACLFSVWCKYI